MRILVTRPQPDAARLAADIVALGHDPVIEPLLRSEAVAARLPGSGEFAAIVVTSRNALRAVANSPQRDDLVGRPLYSVGTATSELARQLGFSSVHSGTGDAATLAEDVIADFRDRPGNALLYLQGEQTAFDMEAALRAAGLAVISAIVYRMVPARELTPGLVRLLDDGKIGAVTLMSARTANVWCDLVVQHSLEGRMDSIVHLCLSPAVAQCIPATWSANSKVPTRPVAEELLALINP